MDLSIVDISHTPIGGTAVEALANSVDLAQHAERLGYRRIWYAEHHNVSTTNCSSNPEVLIARAAALTSRIRVGSGVVQLNHYSPFKVAESFAVLEAMSPGRIDLGLGRSGSAPEINLALQRLRHVAQDRDDYAEQVLEVLAWLDSAFPDDHPFAGHPLLHGVDTRPQPWLLGSSPGSAALAGRLGMRYCFAGFINPRASREAARTYEQNFRASGLPSNPAEPYFMYAMNVSVGETEQDAARLRSTVELFYARLRRGEFRAEPLPSPEQAVVELGGLPAPSVVEPGGHWPQHISGSPDHVAEMLDVMARETSAREIMVQDLIIDHEDRRRSYELLASTRWTGPERSLSTPTGARD